MSCDVNPDKASDFPTPPGKSIANEIARCDALVMLTLLLQYPSDEMVNGLKAGTLQEDILSIGAELGWREEPLFQCVALLSSTRNDSEAEVLRRLARERTRLFDHPDAPRVPLYEDEFLFAQSHEAGERRHRPPRFVNRAANSAEQFFLRGGFKRTSAENIPADCMTTELAFLAALSQKKASALLEGDEEEAERLACLTSEFNNAHVDRWFVPFYTELAREADGFYAGVGSLGLLLFA